MVDTGFGSGVSKYHTGMPRVSPDSWRVAIIGVAIMPDGGNRIGTLTNCPTDGGDKGPPKGICTVGVCGMSEASWE